MVLLSTHARLGREWPTIAHPSSPASPHRGAIFEYIEHAVDEGNCRWKSFSSRFPSTSVYYKFLRIGPPIACDCGRFDLLLPTCLHETLNCFSVNPAMCKVHGVPIYYLLNRHLDGLYKQPKCYILHT